MTPPLTIYTRKQEALNLAISERQLKKSIAHHADTTLSMAARIRAMGKRGEFNVKTKNERKQALTIGNLLRQAGAIDYQLVSRKTGDGFKIAAI